MSRPDWRLPRGVSRSLWEYTQTAEIARLYDHSLSQSGLAQFDTRYLLERLPLPARVVDLGCGTGRTAVEFAARGCEVLGVDLSLEMLRELRLKAEQTSVQVGRLAANLCDLGCLPAGHFDIALVMYATLGMISPAADRARALREIHRIVRPGGYLAFHVHNLWFNIRDPQGRKWLLRDRIGAWFQGRPGGDRYAHDRGIPNSYMHVFRRSELRELLQTAGFTIRHWQPLNARASGPLAAPWWFGKFRANGWLVIAKRNAE